MSRSDRSTIEREIRALYKEKAAGPTSSGSSSINNNSASERKSNYFESFLSSVGKHQSRHSKNDTTLTIAEELAAYRSLAMREYTDVIEYAKEHNPIGFWHLHGQQLNFLASLARKYIVIPVTSVPSESAFSTASFIGRKERSRLNPGNLAHLTFLKDKMED